MTDDKQRGDQMSGDEIIARLRKMMPLRPLTYWEHKTLAERQASKLLQLRGQTSPATDLAWLTRLSKVKVVLVPAWRMEALSGMTAWKDDRWLIAINKGNAPARRRFTLGHEFKHALDANRDTITYQRITDRQREQIADHFAACWLMPKAWVRQAWTNGIQDPEALAGLFGVSRQAMDTRLRNLGFTDDEPNRPVASYFRRTTIAADLTVEAA